MMTRVTPLIRRGRPPARVAEGKECSPAAGVLNGVLLTTGCSAGFRWGPVPAGGAQPPRAKARVGRAPIVPAGAALTPHYPIRQARCTAAEHGRRRLPP